MFRLAAICCVATAAVAATSSVRAQPPMFDPGEMIKRMDDNNNGQIDPSEMEGRARGFLESIARDNNLDLSKPIPNDKLRDIMKARFQGGGSSRSSGGSSSSRSTAPAPAVKAFGVSTTGPTPTVLGFGDSAGADSWDALKRKYDPKVVERTEDSMRRYDRNQDGVLDEKELKENRWDSGHPLDFDKNRDGKVQRNEMAERYKQRYAGGYYDNRGGDRGSYGGGPPPTVSMSSSSSSGSSRGPTPPTGSSGGSSSSGSSGSSSSGGAPDDRMMRYAEGLLKQYDTNKDGTLQRDEWSKMRSESQKADRDGNGLITKEELAAQLADYSKGRSGGSSSGSSSSSNSGSSGSSYSRSSSSGARYSSSGSSAPRSSGGVKTYRFLSPAERLPSGLPDWFTRNDADGDGQIAMAEFSTSWDDQKAAEFTRWDRNGDGVITPKEALGSGN